MRKFFFFIFTLIVICLTLVFFIEIASQILFDLSKNKTFSRVILQQRLINVVSFDTVPANEIVDPDKRDYVSGYIPHPYVGFVENPKGKDGYINTYGWSGPSPITKRSNDTFIIAVFGGSMAQQFYNGYIQSFIALLQQSPVFAGKKIEVVNIALGGYKQPQSLLALEYLLAQGAEYDMIINIDGFNDVTLPGTDNYSQGFAPIFPRSWNWYAQTLQDSQTVYQVSLLYAYHDVRKLVASFFTWYPFRKIMVTLLVWNFIDNKIQDMALHKTEQLRMLATSKGENHSEITGPIDQTITVENISDYSVYIWKNSSQQMAKIALYNGIKYLHILQPTAYLRGSKILTDNEKRLASIDDSISDDDVRLELSYRQLASQGYPRLIQIGQNDLQHTENFVDFTKLFIREQGDMYRDEVHFTKDGYEFFSASLANEVLSILRDNNNPI